jgi:DNA-binding NarL/FixJ family response regulator
MKDVRVLLADDHALVRAGIRAVLEDFPWIVVVGEAGDGREALVRAGELEPDVVLLDISMPGMNGLEAAARILDETPACRVLILSMHLNEEYVLQALRAGASGYVLKDSAPSDLAEAIGAVVEGRTYFSPALSQGAVGEYLRRVGRDTHPEPVLTPRQREILQLIAEGDSTKTIAGRLGLSVKTVEAHRTQIMARLDIHEVAGLVRYAIREGIATAER